MQCMANPLTLIEKLVTKHAVGLKPGQAARSGDFSSAGSSVSCCQRSLPLAATVFIQSIITTTLG